MASLKGVLQLQRFQLDEKRRVLTDLQRLETELDGDRRRLNDTIESEKSAALQVDDPSAAFGFGGFVRGALERRKRIDESLRKVERQIAAATEDTRVAFNDLKKFEQAQAQRLAREAAKRARVESMQLDDIGIEGFRRRSTAS